MKNDFFKDFRQKREVRNGAVVFQKILVKWWLFQQGFYNCSLQTMWYNASSKRCVDDVDDGWQEDVKIVIQKCGGDGIMFTRFCRCTLNYFQDKVIGKGSPVKEASEETVGFGGKLFLMVRI